MGITLNLLVAFLEKHGCRTIKMKDTSDEVIQGIIEDESVRFAIKFVSAGSLLKHNEIMLDNESKQELDITVNFDNMEGHDFERYCASILEKNGFQNVIVTSGSGDQGIDITAEKEGIKYGIQCKCHSQDIGNRAVQEVYAGKAFYKCHVGIVLTNRYFTKSAKKLAESNGIILWDRDKLISLVNSEKELKI